jgi:hypothetical protein
MDGLIIGACSRETPQFPVEMEPGAEGLQVFGK